jgi:hypothetical protein
MVRKSIIDYVDQWTDLIDEHKQWILTELDESEYVIDTVSVVFKVSHEPSDALSAPLKDMNINVDVRHLVHGKEADMSVNQIIQAVLASKNYTDSINNVKVMFKNHVTKYESVEDFEKRIESLEKWALLKKLGDPSLGE